MVIVSTLWTEADMIVTTTTINNVNDKVSPRDRNTKNKYLLGILR
jgi:hypothetical protein